MKYAVLRASHANSRYDACLDRLTAAECACILRGMGVETELNWDRPGGLPLLTFEGELGEEALAALGRLSTLQALFEVHGGMLRPVMPPSPFRCAAEMPSILKYKGKTNEVFTRLMINLAVFSSGYARQWGEKLALLDPMAGMGTTLFCALGYGYSSCGIELDAKEVGEGIRFVKSYLQHEGMKHTCERRSLTVDGRAAAQSTEYLTAADPQAFRAGDTAALEMICGDSCQADRFCRKKRFHILTTDLPYGVQHGNGASKKGSDTLAVLRRALPRWSGLLLPGGVAAFSFNSFTLKREELRQAAADAGMAPLTGGFYDSLEHWVEQAVNRDIVLARKD